MRTDRVNTREHGYCSQNICVRHWRSCMNAGSLVIAPGLNQIGAAFLVGIATISFSFSFQARFSDSRPVDWTIRAVNATFALVALFVPNYTIALAACLPVLIAIGYWLVYRRRLEAGEPEVVELDAKALESVPAGAGALGTMS